MNEIITKSGICVRVYGQTETHMRVRIIDTRGNSWCCTWAGAPTCEEALKGWREDTNSGRRLHTNWDKNAQSFANKTY